MGAGCILGLDYRLRLWAPTSTPCAISVVAELLVIIINSNSSIITNQEDQLYVLCEIRMSLLPCYRYFTSRWSLLIANTTCFRMMS